MSMTSPPPAPSPRLRLPRPILLALITAHIVFGVGLLGDSAGFVAVAVRRAVSADPAFRDAARDMLAMFALFFGVPLSLLALLSGALLALVTKWGLFRYPWVIAKEALIASVIAVGALVLSPLLRGGDPGDAALIVGGTWDVVALLTAAALGVAKPGRVR
jgi:hypothetical protein